MQLNYSKSAENKIFVFVTYEKPSSLLPVIKTIERNGVIW